MGKHESMYLLTLYLLYFEYLCWVNQASYREERPSMIYFYLYRVQFQHKRKIEEVSEQADMNTNKAI